MSFEKELSVLGDVDEFVAEVGQKIAINIDRRVVLETPRDTGTAKGSWLVSSGQPNTSKREYSGEVAQAESAAIEQGARESQTFENGDVLYIQNNQPYIERLNEGSSAQAPSNYIDKIITQEVSRDR